MGSKIPFKHGAKPVQVFDLDDKNVRVALGIQRFINPAKPQKRADRYIHYSDGKFCVLETNSSTLRKAPLQLGSMTELFLKAERPADYLVVVLEDLSSFEREHLYEIRNGARAKRS